MVWLNWVIADRTDDRLTGTVQATVTESPRGRIAEDAWVVGPAWHGRGNAGEAARALVAWLAAQGVTLLVAHIHPDHAASAAIARSAGLAPTDATVDGELRWELALESRG